MNITGIEIAGLFGEADIKIPISDNRIVLVGYNGLGKSTILNIFYYLISQQWSKLHKQDFSTLTLHVDDPHKILIIDRSNIEIFLESKIRRRKMEFRYSTSKVLERDIMDFFRKETIRRRRHKQSQNVRYQIVEDAQQRFGIPLRVADEYYHYYRISLQDELPLNDKVAVMSDVDDFISEHLQGRILYLPTYRRIEKDVKEVFPEIEEELQRKLVRLRESSSNKAYIEFVHFGMEDVSHKIKARLENIRGYALSQVNNLTARYLRDVIRNEANQYHAIGSEHVDDRAINSVFDKVDNAILSATDKEKLVYVVQKINSGADLEQNEKYVAHYVMYLLEIGKNISQFEAPILQFVDVCNSYLFGKRFEFDNIGYKLLIRRDSGKPLELEGLSSGEKQIVSLFSHLLLDDEQNNYIFIDEPELSLSVDWQQRFLSDISRLDSCRFIAAVTHSPFIFENELDIHTVDLLEMTQGTQ